MVGFREKGEREGKLGFVDCGEGIDDVRKFVDNLGDADFREGLCNTTEEFADPINGSK